MPDSSDFQRENIDSYNRPAGMGLGDWLESRVARYETRVLAI